jgi:hypothetical protein
MRIVHDVPTDLWAAIAEQCSYATFFHTPEWARLLESTPSLNCRVATKAFELGPDELVVLPLMECESDALGLVKAYCSNAPGVYGGWIANTEVPPADAARIWSWLARSRGWKIDVFGNPYGGDAEPAGWSRVQRFTHVRRLGFASEEELVRSYAHGVRYYLRKAEQAGYSCRRVESEADVDAYYDAYQRAVRRWGDDATSFYERDLFRNILAARSPRMELWGAYREDRLAGGVVCFKQGGRWIAWHSAFQPEAMPSGVAKFLHHRLILEARRQGFDVYDFNPSGGHEGTVRFKETFGVEKLEFCGFRREDAAIPRVLAGLRAVALRGLVW